jgi:hypothetical protein
MAKNYFWKSWTSGEQYLFYGLAIIMFLGTLAIPLAYFTGIASTFPLEGSGEITEITLEAGRHFGIVSDFVFNLPRYVVEERYLSSGIDPSPWASGVFFIVLLALTLVLLSIFTTLERIYFIIGAGLFMTFIVSMNIEGLALFGYTGRGPLIGILALFGGLAFYFNAFDTRLDLVARFGSFITLAFLVAIVIFLGQNHNAPFVHLTGFSLLFPGILTAIFLFLSGFETIQWLVKLTSAKGINGKNAMLNLTVATIVFIVNILAALYRYRNPEATGLYFIPPILLVLWNGWLGIFNYKDRLPVYKEVLGNQRNGVLMYMCLAGISFLLLAFSKATGNDTLFMSIERFAILAYSILSGLFLLYVLMNFYPIFNNKEEVYKVLMQPLLVPFFTIRVAGFVGIMAFILYSNNFAYKLFINGKYCTIGDAYALNEEWPAAQGAYHEGYSHYNFGQRATLSLAFLAEEEEPFKALHYYNEALVWNPLPETYLFLSNFYLDKTPSQPFQAMFYLSDGHAAFPEDLRIANNLGLMYLKLRAPDSALYVFQKAYLQSPNDPVTLTNLSYLKLKHPELDGWQNIVFPAIYDELKYGYTVNLLALQNEPTEDSPTDINRALLPDSQLNNRSYTYLWNFMISQKQQYTPEFDSLLNAYVHYEDNGDYYDRLVYLQSLYWNRTGHDMRRGMLQLVELQQRFRDIPMYTEALAFELVRNLNYDQATDYYLLLSKEKQAKLWQQGLLAGTLSGRLEDVRRLGDSILAYQNPYQKFAHTMLKVPKSPDQVADQDTLAFFWSVGIATDQDTSQIRAVYQNMQSPLFKFLTGLRLIQALLNQKAGSSAMKEWNTLPKLENLHADLVGEAHFQYLRILAQIKAYAELEKEAKEIDLGEVRQKDRAFFLGICAQAKNDTTAATLYYEECLRKNPMSEESVLFAAYFLGRNNPSKAYEILLDGILMNPYSINLSRAYINQCIAMGYANFAENELARIKSVITEKEYAAFDIRINLSRY